MKHIIRIAIPLAGTLALALAGAGLWWRRRNTMS